MIGEVTVTVYDNKNNVVSKVTESNMILIGAAESLIDALTVSPSLSGIPSASSILDTSNYTIQGITLGKGFDAFQEYAHHLDVASSAISTTAVSVINPGATSSLATSSVSSILNPSFPHPDDRRLERNSTLTRYTLHDIGHNLNSIEFSATMLDDGHGGGTVGLSSLSIGCYPPKGGVPLYYYSNSEGAFIGSSLMTGRFNENDVMDASGMINMTVTSIEEGNALSEFPLDQGLYMTPHTQGVVAEAPLLFSALNGQIGYNLVLSAGDFAIPNAYGGIWSLGLWVIDTKAMICSGINPPFAFNSLDNKRLYKLFAKKIFSRDLTYARDVTTDSEPGNILNYYTVPPVTNIGVLAYKAKIEWRISF